MITGNKGEWSEFYTFIKLLADGKVYAADKNLDKNEDLFYKILRIIRENKNEGYEYLRNGKITILNAKRELVATLSIDEVVEYSKRFYDGISKGKKGDRTFELSFADEILNKFHTNKLSDERKQTADIRIVIHDPITQHEPLLGFSIKSYIGSKPTLFNASKNSNIIYRIFPDLDSEEISKINGLDTYGKRIKCLTEKGYSLQYKKMSSEIFKTNLELIDSKLPDILANIALQAYLNKKHKLTDLVNLLNFENPCDFNLNINPNFYTYKIKRFLVDAALGMKAGVLWNGTLNATGGYLVVKKDGSLVCYHVYNWNDFQDYLLMHTKIDYPDSKPSRCDFGRIISAEEVDEPDGVFIKLNFQIRFI